jgi:hypothetical protein
VEWQGLEWQSGGHLTEKISFKKVAPTSSGCDFDQILDK